MNKKPKLIVFDMQGTIFKSDFLGLNNEKSKNSWEMIARYLGSDANEFQQKMYKKWKRDKLTYTDWMEKTAENHQQNNLHKSLFTDILNHIPYRDGFGYLMNKINNANIETAIISGGFKYQAERVKKDYDINYIFTSGEYYWDNHGYISDWNIMPTGHHGKSTVLKSLIKDLDISPTEIIFIGDGSNDVPIAQFVQGITISINGTTELNNITDFKINTSEINNTYKYIYNNIVNKQIYTD